MKLLSLRNFYSKNNKIEAILNISDDIKLFLFNHLHHLLDKTMKFSPSRNHLLILCNLLVMSLQDLISTRSYKVFIIFVNLSSVFQQYKTSQ